MKRSFFMNMFGIIAVVIGIMALPGCCTDETETIHKPVPLDKNLPNFHEVHSFLFRGGEPSLEGLKRIKEMGITTVIDLRSDHKKVIDEAKVAKELGLNSINLPMSSAHPTKKQVETFISEVEKAKDGKSGPVFVHCAHGSDRTGCLVGVWRVTHDGFNYDQAYKEMRKYYFSPKFTNLSDTVKEYSQIDHNEVVETKQ